jgi:putative membrane protein
VKSGLRPRGRRWGGSYAGGGRPAYNVPHATVISRTFLVSGRIPRMFDLFGAGFEQTMTLSDAFQSTLVDLVRSILFGLMGIAMLLLGYWMFEKITPRLDVEKELCEKNLAVAVVVGALLLGIAFIVGWVVH